jgi:hypothetical protein
MLGMCVGQAHWIRVASELVSYNLNLVAVIQVLWYEGGSQPADDCTYLHVKGKVVHMIN